MTAMPVPTVAWFRLPLEFRQRWWATTEHGRKPAPGDLIAELRVLMAEMPNDEPKKANNDNGA